MRFLWPHALTLAMTGLAAGCGRSRILLAPRAGGCHDMMKRTSQERRSLSAHRREDRRAERLARRDSLSATRSDQGGGPWSGGRVEMERGSGLVTRRIDLHRRDLQERRDLLQRRPA